VRKVCKIVCKGRRKYKGDYDIIAKRHKLCHGKRTFRNDRQGIISGDVRVPDTKRRGPFTLGGVQRLLHAFLRKIFLQSIKIVPLLRSRLLRF